MENRKTGKRIFALLVAIAGIGAGLLMIVYHVRSNRPIVREDAIAYSGTFESYQSQRNYCTLFFQDGTQFEIYAHTETKAFRERMESLETGAALSVLVNPNNHYVVEIRTDSEELLNFEESIRAKASYDKWYLILGTAVCVCGLLLILLTGMSIRYNRKGRGSPKAQDGPFAESRPLRRADPDVKHKVLLEANAGIYRICYRRVKTVNELVVNGQVYDEKKGLFEFAHALYAEIDGHEIEAGLDETSHSYIRFDGKLLAQKRRIV